MMSLPPMGSNWPFPSVNGEQTPESVELQRIVETMKPKKPLSAYAKVMADPKTEESLL